MATNLETPQQPDRNASDQTGVGGHGGGVIDHPGEPSSLGFRPKARMTRWFDPLVLIPIAWQLWKTRNLLPERESQPRQPTKVVDYSKVAGDFWFDYVSDLGDAFDPTMAIAWLAGRTELRRPISIPACPTPSTVSPTTFPNRPKISCPTSYLAATFSSSAETKFTPAGPDDVTPINLSDLTTRGGKTVGSQPTP